MLAEQLREAVSGSEIDRVVQRWVAKRGQDNPEIPPIKDIVFRIMSADEWSKVKRGYYTGSFWSSDPTEYARGYLDDKSILAVAKAGGVKRYRGLPDKKKIARGEQHYHNLDKKELSNILVVYARRGSKLVRLEVAKQ